jgi:hypothetical protein
MPERQRADELRVGDWVDHGAEGESKAISRYVYQGRHLLGRLFPGSHRAGWQLARIGPVIIGVALVAVTALVAINLGGTEPATVPPAPAASDVPTVAPPPGESPAPQPAPPPAAGAPVFTSYEAEQALLVGGVQIAALAGASGGKIVQNIGRDPQGRTGLLVFAQVAAARTGRYALSVDYVSGDTRTAQISINNARTPIVVEFAGNGVWDVVQHRTLTVDLVVGYNTIAVNNPYDVTPRLDRITVYG